MNSSVPLVSRRRFITIAAASAAFSSLPFHSVIASATPHYRWNGVAMGAAASLQFHGKTKAESEALCKRCLHEIIRLEQLFSLYEPNSLINQLNRHGAIEDAPIEFVELVSLSKYFGDVTEGMFDVTIQPVWQAIKQDKPHQEIEAARALVDYRNIQLKGNSVTLTKNGMALTLNGIAQGYITDKVTMLLKQNGVEHVLVNMGEFRAVGRHSNGSNWKVGIRTAENPASALRAITLNNMALATSAGYGTPLGSSHHLLNPKTANASHHYKSLSILAPDATTADALSTGLYHLPPEKAQTVVERSSQKPLELFYERA